MDYAYRAIRTVKYFYNSINPATLSGAIDVVVVEQPNGEYSATPFHVRFGKYGVFSFDEKYVDILINGEEIDLKMKLGDSGVAFFVEETGANEVPDYLLTSPLPEQETPTQNVVSVDKILAESAKKLEKSEKKEPDAEECPKSRSSSPDGGKANVREPQPEQTLSYAHRKQNLPFSSSVFSDRKNRSLPDLTVISQHDASGNQSEGEDEATKQRTKRGNTPKKAHTAFHHSQSQSANIDKSQNTDFLKSLLNQQKQKSNGPQRKKSRLEETRKKTAAIQIVIDDSESGESSVASSANSSPSHSLLDQREIDRIADGALSDSEVDMTRGRNATPEPHDVTDWKWGELPETRQRQKELKEKQEKDAAAQKKKQSTWSWLWSRSSDDDAATSSEQQKPDTSEEGISLDDLLKKDSPDQLRYLGKPPSVASLDSGHVSNMGPSQPASPVASYDERAHAGNEEEEKTPTRETMSLGGITANGERRGRNVSDGRSRASSDDLFPLSEDELENGINFGTQYMQSLRLSSEKLKSLGLAFGANECRFSITTRFQGTTWCSCNIYLYKWYEKLVISDIDGTITKSDVLGHVIPAIGGTWAHAGVTDLYTRIKTNGYKMVYLSSRAIGQSHMTKQYLKSVAQNSKQLPDGPVLLSPTSIITAFRREVIERRPEEFKIAALSDLKKLFPTENPFYAGFGNRDTDVKSYLAVDVPPARILIIDPSGRVRRSDTVAFVSSYETMANETADYLFPPLSIHVKDDAKKTERLTSAWAKPLEHSDFTHWTHPEETPFDVDDELKGYEERRKVSMRENKK